MNSKTVAPTFPYVSLNTSQQICLVSAIISCALTIFSAFSLFSSFSTSLLYITSASAALFILGIYLLRNKHKTPDLPFKTSPPSSSPELPAPLVISSPKPLTTTPTPLHAQLLSREPPYTISPSPSSPSTSSPELPAPSVISSPEPLTLPTILPASLHTPLLSSTHSTSSSHSSIATSPYPFSHEVSKYEGPIADHMPHRMMIRHFNEISEALTDLRLLTPDFRQRISGLKQTLIKKAMLEYSTYGVIPLKECTKAAIEIISEGRKHNQLKKVYILCITDGVWEDIKDAHNANKIAAEIVSSLGEDIRNVVFVGFAIAKNNYQSLQILINNLGGKFYEVSDTDQIPPLFESVIRASENEMHMLGTCTVRGSLEQDALIAHVSDLPKTKQSSFETRVFTIPNHRQSSLLLDITIPPGVTPPTSLNIELSGIQLLTGQPQISTRKIPLDFSSYDTQKPSQDMMALQSNYEYRNLFAAQIKPWLEKVSSFISRLQSTKPDTITQDQWENENGKIHLNLVKMTRALHHQVIRCRKLQPIENLPIISALLTIEEAIEGYAKIIVGDRSEILRQNTLFNKIRSSIENAKIEFEHTHILMSQVKTIQILNHLKQEDERLGKFRFGNFSMAEASRHLALPADEVHSTTFGAEKLLDVLSSSINVREVAHIVLEYIVVGTYFFRPSRSEGPCFAVSSLQKLSLESIDEEGRENWTAHCSHERIDVLPDGSLVLTEENSSLSRAYTDINALIADLDERTSKVQKDTSIIRQDYLARLKSIHQHSLIGAIPQDQPFQDPSPLTFVTAAISTRISARRYVRVKVPLDPKPIIMDPVPLYPKPIIPEFRYEVEGIRIMPTSIAGERTYRLRVSICVNVEDSLTKTVGINVLGLIDTSWSMIGWGESLTRITNAHEALVKASSVLLKI